MKPRKIAIIIAGGVSLGSYEAGVLTELLYALDKLNKEAGTDQQKFVLDVMTGGSAGGMTAVLVARIMMYDLQGRRKHLFKVWVEDVDIIKLMKKAPKNALLSKGVINKIAKDYIIEDLSHSPAQPASFAPSELYLGLSLSNMHGIDYSIPYFPPQANGSFISTFFSDFARFKIETNNPSNQPDWKLIADCGIACGNFPIVFQPQAVPRQKEDYKNSVQYNTSFLPGLLSFLDGGMFNNEPLREAIHLAAVADGGIVDPNRIFLLVDPNINESDHEANINPDDPLQRHLMRIVKMVFGESTARDWLRTQRVNNQLGWRENLIKNLSEIIKSSTIQVNDQIVTQLHQAAEDIVEKKRELFSADRYPNNYLDKSLARIREQYKAEYNAFIDDDRTSVRQKIFERLIFILNNVSGLQNKSVIQPALIGSNPEETAGDQLYSFAGFFSKEWREHDYRRGRIRAHKMLPTILGCEYPKEVDENGQILKDYEIPEKWSHYPKVQMKDADEGLRKEFRDLAVDRVMNILKPRLNWSIRWAVKKWFVKKEINKILELMDNGFLSVMAIIILVILVLSTSVVGLVCVLKLLL